MIDALVSDNIEAALLDATLYQQRVQAQAATRAKLLALELDTEDDDE